MIARRTLKRARMQLKKSLPVTSQQTDGHRKFLVRISNILGSYARVRHESLNSIVWRAASADGSAIPN
jgi:hypothetical protein